MLDSRVKEGYLLISEREGGSSVGVGWTRTLYTDTWEGYLRMPEGVEDYQVVGEEKLPLGT